MLNIDEIIHDAIETCGVDIEGLIEEVVSEQLDNICQKATIKGMIESQIRYTIYSKEEDLTDKVQDSISDYIEEAVDDYIG